jgi:polyisoprenoid-binding protein YceI
MFKVKLSLISLLLVFTQLLQAEDEEKSSGFIVNPSLSSIEWSGRKVTGAHNGNIGIKEGHLVVDGLAITGGAFVIDMNTITCTDLTNEGSNTRLVNHLKSDDFFGTNNHPFSNFVIKSAKQKSGDQYDITGDLTIKDITHEITFPATVRISQNRIMASADITVDRTKYDIKFRSGRFFDSLGDRLIHDDFNLKIELVASQEAL